MTPLNGLAIHDRPMVNPDNIPAILKDWDNWVLWAYEERDGELAKIPKNPRTGGNAMANVADTWGTFDKALTYFRTHTNNGVRGLGFQLGDRVTAFVGVDLDHCLDPETGKIDSWAQKIVSKLNSYTEITPSGEGLRIFIIGRLPDGGRKKGNFECYDSGRFLTITGNHLEGTPLTIEGRWDEIEEVHRGIFGDTTEEPKTEAKIAQPVNLEDEELLTRARNAANGLLFRALYDDGDISRYSSHSEADLSLCGLLAFWTGNDADRVDRLFRQSPLYRPKWDKRHHSNGNTYGQETVKRAVDGNHETYQGPKGRIHIVGESVAQEPAKTEALQFPDEVLIGACGSFADAYAELTEVPRHFYGLCHLACLGSYLSGKVKLQTILNVQPRLYLLLLGTSGRGRKSTALDFTSRFFQDALGDEFSVMHGVNSGEGLSVFLEKQRTQPEDHVGTLTIYDEFLTFVTKASQKGNSLLSTTTSLFEKNSCQTATKEKQVLLENVHLSLMAACTLDTWERCWTADFLAIGLLNRLFLCPGGMDKLVSLPPPLPVETWKRLRDDLRDIIRQAEMTGTYELTPEAYRLYDDWYRNHLDHKSLHAVRLDTYGLRFMLLLAISDGKTVVDEETVLKATRLMDWEFRVRQQLDPIDADNETAKVEGRIRRALTSGSLGLRDLQRRTNAQRTGLWIWKSALSNLMDNGEAVFDTTMKLYRLTETL